MLRSHLPAVPSPILMAWAVVRGGGGVEGEGSADCFRLTATLECRSSGLGPCRSLGSASLLFHSRLLCVNTFSAVSSHGRRHALHIAGLSRDSFGSAHRPPAHLSADKHLHIAVHSEGPPHPATNTELLVAR